MNKNRTIVPESENMMLFRPTGFLGPNHMTTIAKIKNRKLNIEAILLQIFLFTIAALIHLNQR
ncbi:hypothetical protein [Daejeonella sp.]|uniref:hypothetical protein n=1 Tax=Daejeonella sp. TaxID=2805397 RepID=UPI0025BAED76|nr:hypothetical protein [Daejeonella sp.]